MRRCRLLRLMACRRPNQRLCTPVLFNLIWRSVMLPDSARLCSPDHFLHASASLEAVANDDATPMPERPSTPIDPAVFKHPDGLSYDEAMQCWAARQTPAYTSHWASKMHDTSVRRVHLSPKTTRYLAPLSAASAIARMPEPEYIGRVPDFYFYGTDGNYHLVESARACLEDKRRTPAEPEATPLSGASTSLRQNRRVARSRIDKPLVYTAEIASTGLSRRQLTEIHKQALYSIKSSGLQAPVKRSRLSALGAICAPLVFARRCMRRLGQKKRGLCGNAGQSARLAEYCREQNAVLAWAGTAAVLRIEHVFGAGYYLEIFHAGRQRWF